MPDFELQTFSSALHIKIADQYLCTESVSGLDQLEQTSQQKPSSVESDCHQDGKLESKEEICFDVNFGEASLLIIP